MKYSGQTKVDTVPILREAMHNVESRSSKRRFEACSHQVILFVFSLQNRSAAGR